MRGLLGLLLIPGATSAASDCPVGPLPYCADTAPLAADDYGVRYRLRSGIALGVHVPDDAPRELVVVAPDGVATKLCHDIGGVGWDALAEVPDTDYVFAALQNESEGQGGDLTIVRSRDGGRTWRVVGCVMPPHWSGVVQKLDMRTKRKGIVEVEVLEVGEIPAGAYRAETKDGGRTWSGFRRTEDGDER